MFSKKISWTALLKDSLSEDAVGATTDILQVGLDRILGEGILRDIPILSVVVDAFKFGHSVKEAYDIKKLAGFLSQIQACAGSDGDIYKHLETLNEADKEKRDKELEYILAIVSSYIDDEKPKYLASLYASYIRGQIDWKSFIKYVVILDRLLPGDLETLDKGDIDLAHYELVADSVLRLVANGLMIEIEDNNRVENTTSSTSSILIMADSSMKNYKLTHFGKVFADIVQNEQK